MLNLIQSIVSEFEVGEIDYLEGAQLTCSCLVLPVRISVGAEVQAGGSGPANKMQRMSPQHWARATGCQGSKGLQADPNPARDNNRQGFNFYK